MGHLAQAQGCHMSISYNHWARDPRGMRSEGQGSGCHLLTSGSCGDASGQGLPGNIGVGLRCVGIIIRAYRGHISLSALPSLRQPQSWTPGYLRTQRAGNSHLGACLSQHLLQVASQLAEGCVPALAGFSPRSTPLHLSSFLPDPKGMWLCCYWVGGKPEGPSISERGCSPGAPGSFKEP